LSADPSSEASAKEEALAKEDLSADATMEDAVTTYFDQEVRPHVQDAWIAEDKTVIGYEISFNKYFYVHQPLRDLGEVVQEIRDLEKETDGLLESILKF
jgi:type I restriction enzyme M protein